MNALNRRVQGLEEDLEKTEEKLVAANTKLDKAGTAADDSERAKKVFENKAVDDDKRIAGLKLEIKQKQQMQLMKMFLRSLYNVIQILKRQKKELRVVANNLKSLEVAEEKANQREKSYKEQIKTAELGQAQLQLELGFTLITVCCITLMI